MKSSSSVQYTLRQVPLAVDRALRRKSRREGKSLNSAALEILSAGLRLTDEPLHYEDLSFVAGSWVEDPDFDASIQAQDRVDAGLWR
jgi:hypothetical protein